MRKQDENRFPLRLSDLTRWKIEYWYKRNDCQSRNEFVERAVNFYADYLEGQENEILPIAIQSAIDGRLGLFEDRMAKLLFKQAVETDMGLTVLLDQMDIDPYYLKKLRVESVKNVSATNGRLTFERKAQEQYDEGEDDLWQD